MFGRVGRLSRSCKQVGRGSDAGECIAGSEGQVGEDSTDDALAGRCQDVLRDTIHPHYSSG